MEQQTIPEFMIGAYKASDPEGQAIIENLAARYENARNQFMNTTFIERSQHLHAFNLSNGTDKQLDAEKECQPIREKYEVLANKVAGQYPDQNQRLENDLTAKGLEKDQPAKGGQQGEESKPAHSAQEKEAAPTLDSKAAPDAGQETLNPREEFLQQMKEIRERRQQEALARQTAPASKLDNEQQQPATPATTREIFMANRSSIVKPRGPGL